MFWDALWQGLIDARVAYVAGALVLLTVIARRMPPATRPRPRVPTALLVLVVVLVVATAAEVASGYDARWTMLAAQGLALISGVQIALALCFRVGLPAAGVRLPRILVDICTAAAIGVALIWIGQHAGLSVAGLITTSAVLTAVIGFALQDTLGNVMGGLALQLDQSVRVGDWIALGHGQPSGRVVEIRWRYTSIETRAWETVVVPNSMLMKGVVVVSGRRVGEPAQLRRQIDFYVDFRLPPGEVIDAVLGEVGEREVRHVARTPAPQVLLVALRDSVAHYQLRFWLTELALDEVVDSDVRVRLVYALRRRGIELAIPSQAVLLTADSEARDARLAETAASDRRATIAAVALFAGLEPAIQVALARELTAAPFTAGEVVTREGERDDSLFVIARGHARVAVAQGAASREVARLGPGDFFGEMALMTGEPRSATVVADGELRCWRIDKAAVERALTAHPALAEQLAEVLAERRVQLDAARDGGGAGKVATAKQDLMARISRFFGR